MNTKTSPYVLVTFIFILVLTITGCQPKDTATEQSPTNSTSTPDTNSSDPTNNTPPSINKDIFLDPALTQDKDSLMISQHLYEGLVILDEAGDPQPGIAESWIVSDDQLDYIFTIRPGITFSDNTAITPDIIVNNFNRWFDPQNPLHKDGNYAAWQNTFLGFLGEKDDEQRTKSTVDGIQKVDSNTVLLHLSRPVPEALTYLANPAFAILNTNAVALGVYGGKESEIISSGPYVISSWTDEGLTLSTNEKYWGEIPPADLDFAWK